MKAMYSILFSLILSMNCIGQMETYKVQNIDNYYTTSTVENLKTRLRNVNQNIATDGIRHFPEDNEYLLTGYSYGEFYDWDLFFENIYLSYFGISDYCFTNLKIFLKRQHLSGFVSRTLKEPRPYQHFKPFLAQIALLGSKQIDDYTWLLEVSNGALDKGPAEGGIMNEKYYVDGLSYYERLQKYIQFWFWYQDFDKNGLPVWNSSDHSGMDNQFSRLGTFNSFRYEGVDLACYLFRELRSMEIIAENLGLAEDAEGYNLHALKLLQQINSMFWDEEDGFYYDRDEHTGKLVKVKSVAGFLPLFIGAPTKVQADRLIREHLTNKNEFWTEYPIPAYSKTEPDYDQNAADHGCNWRGTTWVPTNYMVFHGLLDYGYKDIAHELAQKTFSMVLEINSTTREYFNGETGQGLGLDPFFGWSALAYFMPFEFELQYNPTDLNIEDIVSIASLYLDLSFQKGNDDY